MRRRTWLLVLPLFVALVGVGLAGLPPSEDAEARSPEPPKPAHSPPPAASIPPPRPAPVVDSSQEERIRMLERRLEALSARAEASAPVPPPRPSLQEARRQLFEQHQLRLDQHSREAVDPAWSREAQGAFAADFAALTQGQSFQVRGIDCRSTTCVTTVEWPSYAEATEGYALLLQHGYGLDCVRSILLPEPADARARYQAHLFLDCAGLRQQGR